MWPCRRKLGVGWEDHGRGLGVLWRTHLCYFGKRYHKSSMKSCKQLYFTVRVCLASRHFSAHLWSPVQQRAALGLSRLRAGIEEVGMQVEFWFLGFIWVFYLQGLMDINWSKFKASPVWDDDFEQQYSFRSMFVTYDSQLRPNLHSTALINTQHL